MEKLGKLRRGDKLVTKSNDGTFRSRIVTDSLDGGNYFKLDGDDHFRSVDNGNPSAICHSTVSIVRKGSFAKKVLKFSWRWGWKAAVVIIVMSVGALIHQLKFLPTLAGALFKF